MLYPLTLSCLHRIDSGFYGGYCGGLYPSIIKNYSKSITYINLWRTDRDSNPGDGLPPTHFPGVRLRPLGHLSVGGCLLSLWGGMQEQIWNSRYKSLALGIIKDYMYAAVLFAFFLDFRNAHRSNFTGPADMCSTTGLQIYLAGVIANPDQPNTPAAPWWLNR